jgi:hypothetical protein
VIAEAAKLGSDAERAGYVAAHLKIKLDAVSRAPTPLHVPSVVTDQKLDANGNPRKKSDKRADAFAASFGTPVTGAAK